MIKQRFYTDGQYVMQDGEVYVICSGKHNADVVATALNELLEENERLKQQNGLLENTIESLTEQLAHGIEDLMGDSE